MVLSATAVEHDNRTTVCMMILLDWENLSRGLEPTEAMGNLGLAGCLCDMYRNIAWQEWFQEDAIHCVAYCKWRFTATTMSRASLITNAYHWTHELQNASLILLAILCSPWSLFKDRLMPLITCPPVVGLALSTPFANDQEHVLGSYIPDNIFVYSLSCSLGDRN